jgi:hypothetical protein
MTEPEHFATRPWTQAEDDTLRRLALTGLSSTAIGIRMNLTETDVRLRARQMQVILRKIRPRQLRWAEGEGQMKSTPRRPWTPKGDKELRDLVFSACSAEIIAKALNRTTFAVRRRAGALRLPLRKIARRRRPI